MSTLDTDTTAGPKKNWTPVKTLSNKKDCKLVTLATSAAPATYSCSVIDAHFFRNWWTDSGDQDVHLNNDFSGDNYDAIGWLASYTDSTYTASKAISPVLGNTVQFQAITQAYLDKKAADAKRVLDDSKKKLDDAAKALQDAKAAAEAAA